MSRFSPCFVLLLNMVLFLGPGTPSATAKPLSHQDLEKNMLTAPEREQICKAQAVLCHEQYGYRMQDKPEHLWMLNPQNIVLFENGQPKMQWHISADSVDGDEPSDFYQHFIYPKLFAMGNGRYAIARIQSHTESYSGGGGYFESVSFDELQDNGQVKPFIKDYPFSLSSMIRACFSEQQTIAAQDNCHDVNRLTLDIRLIRDMTWQLRYHYQMSRSPASDVPKTLPKNSYRTFTIDLNQAPKTLSLPNFWNLGN